MSKTASDAVGDFFNVFDLKDFFSKIDYFPVDKKHVGILQGAWFNFWYNLSFKTQKLYVLGALAQSVEQRTENPRVHSSILWGAILKKAFSSNRKGFFAFQTNFINLF